ncbi:hypothetical protein [Photorhabdus sp. RW14-46]|uniref:hypothetical protein n=1 Tax=Photorhabdus sp. RW14-46 TaxID=2100168 RepID=UPI0013F3F190|nr:hypothetical protein [Photorhabdus sp. RW14-46]NHB63197.1 hypothetical protein [Photorhabdus sp. RW14-46]
MKFIDFIELIKDKTGENWENVQLEVPDEFNGGWLTIEPENVVVDELHPSSGNQFIKLDCWKTYPEEQKEQ